MQSNDLARLQDVVRTLELHEDVAHVEITMVDVDECRLELAVDFTLGTEVPEPTDLTELLPNGHATGAGTVPDSDGIADHVDVDTSSTTTPDELTGGGGTADEPHSGQVTDEDSDSGTDNDDTTDEFDAADTAVRDTLEDHGELTTSDLAQITGIGEQLLYEILRQEDIDRRRDPDDGRRKLYSLPDTDIEGNGGGESTVTTFEDVETPDWLTESSWYVALDMSDDLDDLVEHLGWTDPDAVEDVVRTLGQTDEIAGVAADG